MTDTSAGDSRRLPRRLVLGAAAVIALVVGWALGRALLGDGGPTEADREALDRAVSVGGEQEVYNAVVGLASDSDRWSRLVAEGHDDLVELLDRAHVALGSSPARVGRAALVVAPLLEGDDVGADVLAALARWTWPILGDPTADPETTAEVFDAAASDDVRLAAISEGMALARIHLFLTDEDVDFTRWARDLAGAGSGSGVSVSKLDSGGGVVRLPAPLVSRVLANWGSDGSNTSGSVRDRLLAIGSADPRGEVGATESVLMAGHLRVIDDQAATGAAEVMVDESHGAQGDTLVGTLDRLMFNVDDSQVRQIRDTVRDVLDG